MIDPYKILGVARGASPDEIKKAFHKLAHQHHPDKGGNAEKFKEVSAAYAMLKDGKAAGAPRPGYNNQPFHGRGMSHEDMKRRADDLAKAYKKQYEDIVKEQMAKMRRHETMGGFTGSFTYWVDSDGNMHPIT